MLKLRRVIYASFIITVNTFSGASAAPPDRIWTSADGKFSTQASFIAIKDNSVILMNRNGRLLNVPFAKLSKQDNAHIASVIRDEYREILKQNLPAQADVGLNAQKNQRQKKQPLPKIKVVHGEDKDLKMQKEEAQEQKRVSDLRKEQLDIDARATALNTKLGELRGRGRELQVNGELILQQIMESEREISRRNADIYDAREAGNTDIVNSHTLQITLLKQRVSEMKGKHAAMVAEYSGLEQQVYGIESQLSTLQETFDGIAEEIRQPAPNARP